MRYLLRFILLTAGFALTTAGLMFWHAQEFAFDDIWPASGSLSLHPLHLLIFGLAVIPPALWEIFLLEHASHER